MISRAAWFGIILCSASSFVPRCPAQSIESLAVNVRLVTDEADAVLAILAKKRAHQTIMEADWQRLFSSEGYVRLKKREAEMQRSFEDAEFKSFILSDSLAERAQALDETLSKWKRAEVNKAAQLALAYLPQGTRIRAKIYPMIKPKANSFVFEVNTDPAIFLYLDPTVSNADFENTLAHELHHIGYGGSCPSGQTSEQISELPQNVQNVLTWIGAFGEGFAMLAAARGSNIHPRAVSKPELRAHWDREMLNFDENLKKVEKFYLDILENRLAGEEEIRKKSFSFFGLQGPWYTVGWKMAVTIERAYGRAKLIECFCDQRKLLATYNRTAAEYNRSTAAPIALWSSSLIEGISKTGSRKSSP